MGISCEAGDEARPIPVTLLTPLNLLLATVAFLPPLVLLYLLKRRRSVRRVASVLLWPQAAEDLEVNAPWRRFRFSWLLLLQAACLLLLAVAVSRPVGDGGGRQEQLVLLIDVGASMGTVVAAGAGGDGRTTRFDLAKERASAAARRWLASVPEGEVRLIAFAKEASLAGGAFSDPRRVAGVLDSLAVREEPSRLEPAAALATAISRRGEGGGGARVVLVSDGVLDASAAPVAAAEFLFEAIDAAAAPNSGITEISAARSPLDPSRIEILARVVSTLPAGSRLPISLRLDGETVLTRMLELGSGEQEVLGAAAATAAVEFGVTHREACLIELRLPGGDSLAADDAAFAAIGESRPLRVAVVAADSAPDPFLLEALRAIEPGAIELLPASEWRTALDRLSPPADLLVLDRIAAAEPPALPSLTLAAAPAWLAAAADSPQGREPAPQGVLRWNRRDQLLRGIDLVGLQVARSLRLSAAAGARSLVEGTLGPLLLAREIDGRLHLLLAFRPGDSTWPVDPGFVVFLSSACDLLSAAGSTSEARVVRTGEPLELRCAADARDLRVVSESGEVVASLPCARGSMLSLPPLPRAGVFRIEGGAWPGERIDSGGPLAVGASLLDARESVNRPRRELDLAVEGVSIAAASLPRSLWPLLAAGALLAILAEWLLYLRAARPPR